MRSPTLLIPLTLLILTQTPTTHAKLINIEWVIPLPLFSTIPDGNASVGDTISFNWPEDAVHNVFIHPSGDCDDKTDAEFIGDVFDTTEYVIKESDAGQTLFFACDVGAHCLFTQNVKFTVADLTSSPTGEPTSGPTGKPTSSPTGEPTSGPTGKPTSSPTGEPTSGPTGEPTSNPTGGPTSSPTGEPTSSPTGKPTSSPAGKPTVRSGGLGLGLVASPAHSRGDDVRRFAIATMLVAVSLCIAV